MDWSKYAPYFKEEEFRCKHTGKCAMEVETMDRLLRLRLVFGAPMVITSGYRDRAHPAEASKATTGAHALGRAADIAVTGAAAFQLVRLALLHGFTGIGVKQLSYSRFIHLDDVPINSAPARPAIWSY